MSVLSTAETGAIELLSRHGQRLASYFREFRQRFAGAPPRLFDSIEYSLTAGGKRLRPALVFECFLACGGTLPETGDAVNNDQQIDPTARPSGFRSALAAAAAIELIHTFSLVHDDLPAMDDDDLRRGQPTNHKVFGEAMAILAGDAMVTMAFQIIASDAEPAIVPALVRELASASGAEGMIGGQVLDIESENISLDVEQLRRLHRMKTGALLTAACRLGGLAAKADRRVLEAVTSFGQHLGLAFQIVDDLLDVTSTPQQLGKATRKDAGKGKNTYPILLGIEGSRREADHQLSMALADLDPLGQAGDRLRTLAQFVVRRDK